MKKSLTIVTGASSNHFDCMRNLIWTVARYEPTARVVAWDLGLTPEQRAELLDAPPFFLANWSLPKFDFEKYPQHFDVDVNSGRMAFRPVTVAAAAREFGGQVFWLDAGCQLMSRLDEMVGVVVSKAPFCRTTKWTIGERLCRSTHAALNVSDDLLALPLRDAGCCAFNADDAKQMELITAWEQAALNPTIVAPPGTTKRTHRQDAVFAVLLNQAARRNGWDLAGQTLPSVTMRCDSITFAEMKRRLFIPLPKASPSLHIGKVEY